MSLPNITQKIIATGADLQIRVGILTETPEQVIGLATGMNSNENFQNQEAVVIGNLGPVSIDAQGYNCSITVNSYVPAKGVFGGIPQYDGDGTKTLAEMKPTRTDLMATGKPKGFAYLDFYNKKEGIVLAAFRGVVVDSYGVQIEGNTYVRSNMQLRSMEQTI